MNLNKTEFPGLYVIEPKVFKDDRGFFFESYSERIFHEQGIDIKFIQDNHAKSVDVNVLRGLHYQKPPYTQSKLIRVVKGAIFDVVVDLRVSSPMYKKWFGVELSSFNHTQLLIPGGFAHGYLVLKPDTEVLYKVDNYYYPEHENGIIWNDPTIAIDWLVSNPILSAKDKILPNISESLGIFQ